MLNLFYINGKPAVKKVDKPTRKKSINDANIADNTWAIKHDPSNKIDDIHISERRWYEIFMMIFG